MMKTGRSGCGDRDKQDQQNRSRMTRKDSRMTRWDDRTVQLQTNLPATSTLSTLDAACLYETLHTCSLKYSYKQTLRALRAI